MSTTVADLEQRYAALSDEEFAALDPADLTEIARECYNREAVQRRRIGQKGSSEAAASADLPLKKHPRSRHFLLTGWGVVITTIGISVVFGSSNAPGLGRIIIVAYWVFVVIASAKRSAE